MRLQTSWLIEIASKNSKVESIVIPYVANFASLIWLKNRCVKTLVNNPVDSQAMVIKRFAGKEPVFFTEKNKRKFNQVLLKPLDIEMNPFRKWNDKYFSREQLDYLFYWHEVAFEIEDAQQKELFWSFVYRIMRYWISHKKNHSDIFLSPDQLMSYYLKWHESYKDKDPGCIDVCEKTLEKFEIEDTSLLILPLVTSEDGGDNILHKILFHTWFQGHSDFDIARKEYVSKIHDYFFSFDSNPNFSKFAHLIEKSEQTVICWTGKNLPPALYSQYIVEPVQKEFSNIYNTSEFSIKAVRPEEDEYDYALLFYNK